MLRLLIETFEFMHHHPVQLIIQCCGCLDNKSPSITVTNTVTLL